MSKNHVAKLFALLLGLVMIAAACTTDSSETEAAEADSSEETEAADGAAVDGCAEGSINISGSSTVEPVSRRAAELYEDVCPETVVTVDGPGTGDGFALFCAGETDISDASRAIKDSEAADCEANSVEFTEIKVANDGIAVMTSPNNAVECLSFVDLYALLGGQSEGYDNWSDASDLATELGSDVAPYPELPLDISAPGTESGTYDSFIEIVLEGLGEENEGEDGQFIRQDFAGNSDDNVIIEGITGSDSSLGWVGFAFADANADVVKALAISEEPGGDCVTPTADTIADNSYPVSRALYIYVNNAKVSENPALAGYVDYYLGDAYSESVTKAFGESGYVELPAAELADVQAAWDAAKG